MYKTILWDIDGTLLNFSAAEEAAVRSLFDRFNFPACTSEMLARYSAINKVYWQKLERNELTKPEILVMRFRDFFRECGLPEEKASEFNACYQLALGDTIVFNEGAWEMLNACRTKYRQYIVTNGTKTAQDKKIALSHIGELTDGIFISEVIGAEKPNMEFFNPVLQAISPVNKEELIIIGDSLTSDIQGGMNCGIDTCWYNPEGAAASDRYRITYEIRSLTDLKEILL